MLITTIFVILVTKWQVLNVECQKTQERTSSFSAINSIALFAGDQGYAHSVMIGSNRKQFTVLVTLNSPLLWIPSIACTTRDPAVLAKCDVIVDVCIRSFEETMRPSPIVDLALHAVKFESPTVMKITQLMSVIP
ncbi:unnamed protein product [Cylicocyclus nassatus]|uniref:Peptidase A1 domain-containing protein n=1 Tax=Cylicocyclus nassatus TaxID=53992 RepID=A0AA36H136_CYLNA|nr:unnamed protein product [Cylicocyclus nassatus]